jgi:hypothetical protein
VATTDRTKLVDPADAGSYAELGRRLLEAAEWIVEVGDARHASAMAILSVHATIAFSDAATIHRAGRKSRSSDHEAALTLLAATYGAQLPKSVASAFRRVVSEKDRFEYQGHVATIGEAKPVFENARRVATWVEGVLATTRRSGPTGR